MRRCIATLHYVMIVVITMHVLSHGTPISVNKHHFYSEIDSYLDTKIATYIGEPHRGILLDFILHICMQLPTSKMILKLVATYIYIASSIPMRGRIKESYWVITKLSPSDNSKEVHTNDSITFDLTIKDIKVTASVNR